LQEIAIANTMQERISSPSQKIRDTAPHCRNGCYRLKTAVKVAQVSRLPSKRVGTSKGETKKIFADSVSAGRRDARATLFQQLSRWTFVLDHFQRAG
jgi:hypothetical protein